MLKHRTKYVYTRALPNAWSPNIGSQSNDPSESAVAQQRVVAAKLNTYQSDGKVQVIPKDQPIPMGKPGSWPPIPPAYVPRPGTLVQVPYVEHFQASDTPATQVRDDVPKIRRSGQVQRPFISGNKDYIATWNLNQTQSSRHTTEKASVSPHPSAQVKRK